MPYQINKRIANHYDGDVIERLDRIEYLLAQILERSDAGQKSVSKSMVQDDGVGRGDRVLLTVAEAAKQLRVSNSYLYHKIASREFPSVKIGRSVRIPVVEMLNWIRKLEER